MSKTYGSAKYKTYQAAIEGMAKFVLSESDDVPTVMLSPVVWSDEDGKRSYWFVVATGKLAAEVRLEQIKGDSRTHTENIRTALIMCLAMKRPIVIQDFDDELQMARCAEAVWPGAKMRRVVENIEAERKQ